MATHIYSSIEKYCLFIPCNVTCMHFFRDGNLVLNIKLVCSFLGKTISPALRVPQLPTVHV